MPKLIRSDRLSNSWPNLEVVWVARATMPSKKSKKAAKTMRRAGQTKGMVLVPGNKDRVSESLMPQVIDQMPSTILAAVNILGSR